MRGDCTWDFGLDWSGFGVGLVRVCLSCLVLASSCVSALSCPVLFGALGPGVLFFKG